MVQLSNEIAENLRVDPGELADVMGDLCPDPEYHELEQQRREILATFFSRKKQMTIQPHGCGYQIKIPSTGLEIVTQDIESGIEQLLDTLISYEALK